MKFYWDPKEQSTKRHPVNIRFPKKTSAAHWRGTVVLASKITPSVLVFYRGNKLWVNYCALVI